jgi:hydrogenase-1 operon protein HyaF
MESTQDATPNPTPAGAGSGIAALVSELTYLLARLAARDETAIIDLRSLSMSASDRVELQRILGDGEVHATLQAEGVSTARKTAVAGLWWIEQRDAHGELIGELLEVACFPQILANTPNEIQDDAAVLQAKNTPIA